LTDLAKQIDGERRLVFVMVVTHALSGTKVVQRIEYLPKDVVEGEYGVGLTVIEAKENF
jgi:hypothetical protein